VTEVLPFVSVELVFRCAYLALATIMKFGLVMNTAGEFSDVRALTKLARDAEAGGWDGFFLFDSIQPFAPDSYLPLADPWLALMAVALSTERIRFGTMVTALARRRAPKVARDTVTLDRTSRGRLVFGVGLGYGPASDPEFTALGEDSDPRVRGAKLDENLEVLTGLWSGEPFAYSGRYCTVQETVFLPKPVQSPRIPIWVGGLWPNHRPMLRAARYDGVFPIHREWGNGGFLSPEDIHAVKSFVGEHRASDDPFEVIFSPSYPDNLPAATPETITAYADSGVTWWLENVISMDGGVRRAREGPMTNR
jgi:alkanesulfonate monooxygenase SsuD/methylene tetrahydromethanopterin reductase-like flavin-dependent oxidoreductase (luciferase family)